MRRPERIQRKDGVRYQLRHADAQGRMRYKTFPTKKEAEAAAAEFDAARRGGTPVEDRRFDELVQEFRDAHLAHGLRASTALDYDKALRRCEAAFGRRPLRGITTRDVEQFRNEELRSIRAARSATVRAKIEHLRAQLAAAAASNSRHRARRIARLSAAATALEDRAAELEERAARRGVRTVNKALAMLRMVFNFAESRRYTTHNPARWAKKVARCAPDATAPLDQNVLTPAELEKLIEHTPADWRAAIMVLGYGGLRIGELRGLQWGDVELDRARLYVRRQLDGATGKFSTPKTAAGTRFVELPARALRELRAWQLRCPPGELCFPMEASNFRNRVFNPALRRAGLRKIRVHDLRHTAASMMIATGADIAAISRQIGHANVNVTLTTYTHWFARRTDSGLGARLEALVAREIGCEMVAPASTAPTATPPAGRKLHAVQ